MEIIFSDSVKKELESMPQELIVLFLKYLQKMQETHPRKHMKQGITFHVEKVTKQARIIYDIKGDNIYILHCFGGHKEYERWYNSYK